SDVDGDRGPREVRRAVVAEELCLAGPRRRLHLGSRVAAWTKECPELYGARKGSGASAAEPLAEGPCSTWAARRSSVARTRWRRRSVRRDLAPPSLPAAPLPHRLGLVLGISL